MCGIIGYLGKNEYSENYIITGLKLLQNRGYDSAGISTIHENQLKTIKYASTTTNNSIDLIENELLSANANANSKLTSSNIENSTCSSYIGHTRWATHGAKTDINSHPHHDNKNRIALVHNGIIENFNELKNNLLKEGYIFHSQTDSGVVAVLIGKFLDDGHTVNDAIEQAVNLLSGTWAFVIIHADFPNKMWVTKNGSPLLLGFEDEFVMISSERTAFGNNIKKYIVLNNNDLIEITKNEQFSYSKNIHNYSLQNQTNVNVELTPGEYPHWMLKEITEQSETVVRSINNGGRILNNTTVKLGGLDNNIEKLLNADHLIILGCGTSYHAGLWAIDIFKQFEIFNTIAIYDGAEFHEKDIPRNGTTIAILLSQSGETKDLHRCIQILAEKNICTIGVVNVVDSYIARETLCGVYLNAGREVAVASTKSFTSQCIVLSLIAVWFSQNKNTFLEKRKRIIEDIYNLEFQIKNIFNANNINKIKTVVSIICKSNMNSNSLFILGKGSEEAIAKEGALKLKEVAYIHAEGYSSSALKHGPFGLITDGLPIILLDIHEFHREKNNNVFQEISARQSKVIKITDLHDLHDSNSLIIDKNKTFGGLLANIYIQLVSYYYAVEKGYNPDFPRNLAKVVTVE